MKFPFATVVCVCVCVCMCVCVCVCVCVCLFPSTVKASPERTKQYECNARVQVSDDMLRNLFCVKFLRRHIINNHSGDLGASNCSREPGRATRSKRQLSKLSKYKR